MTANDEKILTRDGKELDLVEHSLSFGGWLGAVFQGSVWHTSWYGCNHYFKFKVGDRIRLACKRAAGYGIDPHGVVVALCTNEKGEDRYAIDMNSYDYEGTPENERIDVFQWWDGTALPQDCKRIQERQIHFKSNIELHFKKDKCSR